MQKIRDIPIDITRAIAIVLMVAANMTTITHDEPGVIFRFLFSLAAPLFIALVGMMVTLGIKKGMNFTSVLKRGGLIFIIGGLLDILNQLVPFVHFDVLYLIGLSLPLAYLIRNLSNLNLQLLIVGILCATAYLQQYYRFEMAALPTDDSIALASTLLSEIPRRYLIDGWFPIFPWLAMTFFGVLLGRFRYQSDMYSSFVRPSYIIAAAALIAIGGLLWWLFANGLPPIRDGYAELFYPPLPGFMLLAMGVVLATIIFADYARKIALWKLILPLGEASLFMYLFHLLVIKYTMQPFGTIAFDARYGLYFLLLLSVMIIIGFSLRTFRAQPFYRQLPRFARMILGS